MVLTPEFAADVVVEVVVEIGVGSTLQDNRVIAEDNGVETKHQNGSNIPPLADL